MARKPRFFVPGATYHVYCRTMGATDNDLTTLVAATLRNHSLLFSRLLDWYQVGANRNPYPVRPNGLFGDRELMGATYHFMTLGLEIPWILLSRLSRCAL